MFATRKAVASGLLVSSLFTVGFGQSTDVWMKLLNGTDLKGWKCRTANWKVDASTGVVTGSGSINFNTFLITDSMYSDFRFKVTARMPGTGGYRNSGVVYRGKISNATNFEVGGYQADISDNYWGSFYHEQGNELGWTPVSNCSPSVKTEWATLEIIANKDKVTHLVDGKTCWEHSGFKVTEKGIIALQLHNPGDFKVEFKDAYIQPLNASFTILPDLAYDKDGKPVIVTGLRFAPKSPKSGRNASASVLGLGNSVYDANGKLLPLFGARADGAGSAPSKAGHGAYLIAR